MIFLSDESDCFMLIENRFEEIDGCTLPIRVLAVSVLNPKQSKFRHLATFFHN